MGVNRHLQNRASSGTLKKFVPDKSRKQQDKNYIYFKLTELMGNENNQDNNEFLKTSMANLESASHVKRTQSKRSNAMFNKFDSNQDLL